MIDTVDAPLESAHLLAGHIIRQIWEIVPRGQVACYADLHDVCDANEFVTVAAAAFGWDPDTGDDGDMDVVNAATSIVDQWLRSR